MAKNIGDMTNSELIDFVIELQEENSRFERKISKLDKKLEASEKARKDGIELINKVIYMMNNGYSHEQYKKYLRKVLKELNIDNGDEK